MNFQNGNLDQASRMFSRASKIALVGNGGNLSIAQHMASDIYRHTGNFGFAPDSVSITAFDVDGGWHEKWVDYACQGADLIIGISCRLQSPLVTALENVPINVLVGLASKVDPSKSAGDIELPITWTPPILPKYHNFWTKSIIPFERVCICPSTCRPYYNVNGKRWSENLFEKYGLTPESTVSCNELFGNFIVKHKKYPTKDELMIYCYNRMIVHGSHTTLPEEMMDQYIGSTLNDNKEVMSIYTPEEYAKRFLKSRSIVIRIEMEKS
jgi:hypothetical protein